MSPIDAQSSAQCDPESDSCSFPPPRPAAIRLIFEASPFIITFSAVFIIVLHRLFPLLCGAGNRQHMSEGRFRRRLSALAFSTALSATGVLAELILCEVSDWLHGDARQLAFRVAVAVLLACLIVIIPLLEIYSLVESAHWDARSQLIAISIGFCGWLWIFWISGDWIPIVDLDVGSGAWTASKTLSEECLARVGVVGVSLMAFLSGFGCVSTPWQTFGVKKRPVSDTDVARAQTGLDATRDMISSKRAKLRLHNRRIQDKSSTEGFISKVMSSMRTDADEIEQNTLNTEISGLESMAATLAAEFDAMQLRKESEKSAGTAMGHVLTGIFQLFSVYCMYRIAATMISHLPRLTSAPSSSFSQSDPINNILAIIAKHWDPDLDRVAWSRQISFLLSGVIILGSLSSVLTTVKMLSRSNDLLKPASMVHEDYGGTNFALFVSQLCAVYVLASALLLRSNLPPEVSSVLTESLGAPLDPAWVDRWFDGVFLASAALTLIITGVWKRVNSTWRVSDYETCVEEDIEMGKQC